MAKSIDLLLILFSSLICVYHGNDGVYVKAAPSGESRHEIVRKKLKAIYSNEIGVREKANKNDGERIAEYLKYTGLPEGYAWCAAFISWSFGKAGLPEPKTAWSPSLFPAKRIIWKQNGGMVKKKISTSLNDRLVGNDISVDDGLPKAGDVFGIYFSNLKRVAHAGFVDEWGDKFVITVEGNTNNGGVRDGDGVYRKRRPVSSIYQVSDWVSDQ